MGIGRREREIDPEEALQEWSSSRYAVLESFDLPHKLETGVFNEPGTQSLEDFFIRWGVNPDGRPILLDPNEVWDEKGLHVPAPDTGGYTTGAIVSRLSKRWPVFATQIVLPTLKTDRMFKLAFDTGHKGLAGDITFVPERDNETEMVLRSHTTGNVVEVRVTNFLPADYDTAENVYRLFQNKGQSWLTINNQLRAVILSGVPIDLPKWENNPPYSLASLNETLGSEFLFKTRAWSLDEDEFTFPLSTEEQMFGMFQAQPHPPRQFPLYNENTSTKWNGQTTSVQITSHPVPIWGYPRKTLAFESDAAGTLDIEVYAGGGWRVFESPAITAGELLSYHFPQEMQYPIARCVYTPTNADTITLGEMYLA